MIFEDFNFDYFMDTMLSNVPSTMDKREGAVIWDALAPAAIEFTNVFLQMSWIVANSYADTATGEWLDRRAMERGLHPYEASPAVLKGEFDVEIPLHTRFNLDVINYYVSEKLYEENGKFYYALTCEEDGIVGNITYGELIPMDYVEGLKHALAIGVITPGEEVEEEESFRARYFRSLNNKAFGGNIQDYKNKMEELQGVGGVKVYPVWNGGGTVKIVFTTSEHKVPSNEFVKEVQEIIDPIPFRQKGKGQAPIGHYVTVEGAKGKEVNLTAKFTFKQGYTFEILQDKITEKIEEYLLSLRKLWEDSEDVIVRISRIESHILDIEGIIDIEETQVNSSFSNLELGENDIPVLGVISNA